MSMPNYFFFASINFITYCRDRKAVGDQRQSAAKSDIGWPVGAWLASQQKTRADKKAGRT